MNKLITAAEVISIALLDNTFVESKIKDVLIDLATYRHIRPILNDDFYTAVMASFSVSPPPLLSVAAYESLNNDYIKYCLAFYVVYTGLTDNYLQLSDVGITENTIKYSYKTEIRKLSMVKHDVFSKAKTYAEKLTEYLNDNITSYPLYTYDGNIINRFTTSGGFASGK